MSPRPSLSRLADRPRAADWHDDELVTLAEAAALFFPQGPMTAIALRVAHRRGELAATLICGKVFTTPSQVRAMMTPQLREVVTPVTPAKVPNQDGLPARTAGRRARTKR